MPYDESLIIPSIIISFVYKGKRQYTGSSDSISVRIIVTGSRGGEPEGPDARHRERTSVGGMVMGGENGAFSGVIGGRVECKPGSGNPDGRKAETGRKNRC